MRRPALSGGSSVTAGNYVLHDMDRAGQAVLASGYDRVWLKKRPAIQLHTFVIRSIRVTYDSFGADRAADTEKRGNMTQAIRANTLRFRRD
jgi:hypothetical protein